MSFHVGQKVECVDTWPKMTILERIRDTWDCWRHPYTDPVKGEIYTITNIYVSPNTHRLCLELAELTDADPDFWLPGFYACGFHPIVERKTDISVFKSMLIDRKVEA